VSRHGADKAGADFHYSKKQQRNRTLYFGSKQPLLNCINSNPLFFLANLPSADFITSSVRGRIPIAGP
jgi:hypothetical protein